MSQVKRDEDQVERPTDSQLLSESTPITEPAQSEPYQHPVFYEDRVSKTTLLTTEEDTGRVGDDEYDTDYSDSAFSGSDSELELGGSSSSEDSSSDSGSETESESESEDELRKRDHRRNKKKQTDSYKKSRSSKPSRKSNRAYYSESEDSATESDYYEDRRRNKPAVAVKKSTRKSQDRNYRDYSDSDREERTAVRRRRGHHRSTEKDSNKEKRQKKQKKSNSSGRYYDPALQDRTPPLMNSPLMAPSKALKREKSSKRPYAKPYGYPPAAQTFNHFSVNDVTMGIRRKLQIFLDDPSSSTAAMIFALLIAFMVILSSVAVIIESLPVFYHSHRHQWFIFESGIIFLFTIEWLMRAFAHSTSWRQFNRFFFSGMNLIDLIAIGPYFIELTITGGGAAEFQRLTVFRLFRLIRLLRFFAFSQMLQLSIDAMFIALKKSTDAMVAILFFQCFIIIVFSTLIFYFERGEWNEAQKRFLDREGLPSHFDSIPATFWFVAEVITTVGLGDVYPKTTMGRFLTFPLMLFGLLIIALPSIVLGKNFAEAWLWLKTAGSAGAGGARFLYHSKKAKKTPPVSATTNKKEKSKPSSKKPSQPTSASVNEDFPTLIGSPLTSTALHLFENGSDRSQGINGETVEVLTLPKDATAIDMPTDENESKDNDDYQDTRDEDDQHPTDENFIAIEEEPNEEDHDQLNEDRQVDPEADRPYFVSPETLLQNENQSEILQLVQMLVEQFQMQQQTVERLANQQEDLMVMMAGVRKGMKKQDIKEQEEEEEEEDREADRGREDDRDRDRDRDRDDDDSRSRRRDRDRSRSRSSSRSRRARSRTRSKSRFTDDEPDQKEIRRKYREETNDEEDEDADYGRRTTRYGRDRSDSRSRPRTPASPRRRHHRRDHQETKSRSRDNSSHDSHDDDEHYSGEFTSQERRSRRTRHPGIKSHHQRDASCSTCRSVDDQILD